MYNITELPWQQAIHSVYVEYLYTSPTALPCLLQCTHKHTLHKHVYNVLVLNQCAQVPKRNPANECAVFGVLLAGETGSGKSALILLGEEVASEGHTCRPESATITQSYNTYSKYSGRSPSILYDQEAD